VQAKAADGGKIYVQQICHAISEIDINKKLNGLMVAGYTSGVNLVKDTRSKDEKNPDRIPDRIFKSTQLYNSNRPDESLNRPMHPAWKKERGYEKKMTEYLKRKRVFVWQDGKWRDGAISE
jgi:hypothetical protein